MPPTLIWENHCCHLSPRRFFVLDSQKRHGPGHHSPAMLFKGFFPTSTPSTASTSSFCCLRCRNGWRSGEKALPPLFFFIISYLQLLMEIKPGHVKAVYIFKFNGSSKMQRGGPVGYFHFLPPHTAGCSACAAPLFTMVIS